MQEENHTPTDRYRSIEAPSTGVYKDNGSKFLAFAYPVETEEQAKEHIAASGFSAGAVRIYAGAVERA